MTINANSAIAAIARGMNLLFFTMAWMSNRINMHIPHMRTIAAQLLGHCLSEENDPSLKMSHPE